MVPFTKSILNPFNFYKLHLPRFDYYGSFGAGAICNALGFFYVLFVFKETKKQEPEDKGQEASILSLKNLSNSFKVLTKERSEGLRHVVILLVVCSLVRSCFHETSGKNLHSLKVKFSVEPDDPFWGSGLLVHQKTVSFHGRRCSDHMEYTLKVGCLH